MRENISPPEKTNFHERIQALVYTEYLIPRFLRGPLEILESGQVSGFDGWMVWDHPSMNPDSFLIVFIKFTQFSANKKFRLDHLKKANKI